MTIKIIAAVDLHGGLGYKNELLFHVKEDLKHFKSCTLNHYAVMGSKTYESLPNKLPNRTIVVVTRDKKYKPKDDDVIVVNDISKLINHYNTGEQNKILWICGGSEIYKEFIPYADEVHLTEIVDLASKVDTYFPMDLLKEYFEIDESAIVDCSKDDICVFSTYKRKEIINEQ